MTPGAGTGRSRRVRRTARLVAGMFIPHTVVLLARRFGPGGRSDTAQAAPVLERGAAAFSYEDAVSFLVGQGVDEQAVRIGSIPAPSIRLVAENVERHLPRRPLRVLHIGNYVGLSLAALSEVATRHHPQSTVVSIDPNLSPLGVEHPQDRVVALLSHFGFQRSNVVICGYSLEKADVETAVGGFGAARPAGEQTLDSLERLGACFDLVLIDGNHDSGYLRRELEGLLRLTEAGALLVVDDVSHVYKDVRRLFKDVAVDRAWPLEQVARDERVGILRATG